MMIICNNYHSGNRSLVWDRRTGSYQCQGCGTWHTREQAQEARKGQVQSYNGAGGVVRVR